jgi:HEAT repeat protein
MRTLRHTITFCTTAILLLAHPTNETATAQEVSAGRSESVAAGESIDWNPQDPADSLYREARERLNRGDYRRAARLFRDVRRRYSRSSYVADALYYEAFALYRTGDDDALREALEALELQREEYPDAATRGDAAALETRIEGELARLGDAEAAERVTERASGIGVEGECPEEDDDIRLAALNALLNMNAERAIPILKKVLERREACSEQLRRKAVFLVSQQHSDETTSILLDAARNDPDPEVRSQAVFWLSQVSSEEAVDALEDILFNESEIEIQEKAIFALSQHHSDRASAILRDYAERRDVPTELREKAIFWIGQHDSAENAEYLRGLYETLEDEELKEKVIFSLSQLGRRSGEWLLEIARDPSEPVNLRKKAIFWASQSGASMGEFAALYDAVSEREIREQLIFAFSQSSRREAVDKLMDIARSDADEGLRKKAIFWLGQSNDPRAAEFLLELIEQ